MGRGCASRKVGGSVAVSWGGSEERCGFLPERVWRGRVSSAVALVVAVALSGVFLIVFVPQMWWIFTTYFWVAFPALGSLSRGLSAVEKGPRRVSAADVERELLAALRRHGEVTPALVAAETPLSVAEADRRLGELAGDGHLEVRARGGAIFYTLWDREAQKTRSPADDLWSE